MTPDKDLKGTILVVDDQPANLKVLLTFLKGEGFKILIANSGERALAQMAHRIPDLILLDIMMPGLDGFETCRLLKQDPSLQNIPVIFITALTEIDDKIKGFNAGGVDYITKPFHRDEVLIRLNTHISLHRLQQELQEKNRMLLASQTAIEEAKKRFEHLAIHDDLTGLYNRRHLRSCLLREFQRCLRYNCDLSCLLLDIDHFKNVNDTLGHDFGDFVLSEFGKRLMNETRSSDECFRMGGEEFFIVLPETCIEGALIKAERIRSLCGDTPFTGETTSRSITVSIGVSSLKTHNPANFGDLVNWADNALYIAKNNGRNRVNCYEAKEEAK